VAIAPEKPKVVNSQEEIFAREVDEALQQDELRSLWDRYGKMLVAALVLGLAAFGGYLFWQDRKEKAAGEVGETYDKAISAIDAGNKEEASKLLDGLKSSDSPGYRGNALMTKAVIMIDNGDLKGAAAQFGQVAADKDLPQEMRDAATVRQSALEFDTVKPEAIIARLSPLAVKGHSWHGSAGEMVGHAYLKQNNLDKAKQVFQAISSDETVPETIRTRAVQMTSAIAAGGLSGPVATGNAVTQNKSAAPDTAPDGAKK
jgi:hypothetical protein